MSTVALLVIATNKYKQYVQQLLDSANEYFMPNNIVHYHLFLDADSSVNMHTQREFTKHMIRPYTFPEATLLRYELFNHHKDLLTQDYLFYTDVDMRFENSVSTEILCQGLTAVSHPGFHTSKEWGSANVDPRSTAFLPMEKRGTYYAGGFQGGERTEYLKACEILSSNIKTDQNNNILAEWHDESHWNKYLHSDYQGELKVLTPEYCMVENQYQREVWAIAGLTPRIVALDKNHQEVRS